LRGNPILIDLQYWILKRIAPKDGSTNIESTYDATGKITALLGEEFFGEILGKTVIDFGCGIGQESVEIARRGAAKVIGLDIQHRFLEQARDRARLANVQDICLFTSMSWPTLSFRWILLNTSATPMAHSEPCMAF